MLTWNVWQIQTTEFRNLNHMDFLIRKKLRKHVEGPIGRDRSITNILS